MSILLEFEKEIDQLIDQMTIEEKVSLCHANSKFTVASIERLGIEELVMSDGPHGVRPEMERHSWTKKNRPEDACTYLPTGTALAATWNPDLGYRYGEVLGSEARYRGKDIILGPGVNIIRTPLGGRNFEYMSEDPCLTATMVPSLVQGIQSQDVAACVKHYCLNNQELDRFGVNVEVSDRALHEIYLKGFQAAVTEGGAYSVMGAYNKFRGQHCCHNDYLINKVLKGEWGFDGVYLTDWDGTHDTEEAIYNGLDIEMGTELPYNEYYLADAFLERAKESEEIQKLLDDKVRRILRLMLRIHKFSPDRNKGEFNTKEHQQVAYDVAAESMVLLKNEGGVLPIDKMKLTKLLVVGLNADAKHAAGGNSSGIMAFYEITPLQGIMDRLSDLCEIEYHKGIFDVAYKPIPVPMLNIIDLHAGCRAYKHVEYWKEQNENIVEKISYLENGNIVNGVADSYDIQLSVDIPETGNYSFRFETDNCATIYVGEHDAINLYYNRKEQEATCAYYYEKDTTVDIRMHIERKAEKVNFRFGWIMPSDYLDSSSEAELLEKAQKADYVIYCGGLDHSYDTECFDKKSMLLPSEQDVLIPKLLEANANTIIAITAGSPVTMPWIEKAKAVIWTWYAGMETGHVLGDILIGKISPSGKMPFTLPKEYADTPVARYGEYQERNCEYKDGVLVGYRGFDFDNIEPMFPFGHGLSYSTFVYSALKLVEDKDRIIVTCKVCNTGSMAAMETVQVYIGDPECSVIRPVKELKSFKKVKLLSGESTEIILSISKSELTFWSEETDGWKMENGEFTVMVGASSRDIRLTGSFHIG